MSEFLIPKFKQSYGWEVTGWEEVPIEECGEKLVLLDNLAPNLIVVSSEYKYLRSGAAQRLINAAIFLQRDSDSNPKIFVYDAYKPLQAADLTKPSPHLTGGAIDLSIIIGNYLLQMTPTEFDDESDFSRTDYFHTNGKDEPDAEEYRTNRDKLYNCMLEAGFTNNPEQWRHFDYGDQFWGKITGNKAIYGPVIL